MQQQNSSKVQKLPQINNQAARYVHVLRNNKGKFQFPNSMTSNSIAQSSIHYPNKSIVDDSIIQDFQTLKSQIQLQKPTISIFKQIKKDQAKSQNILNNIEYENSFPLKNMQTKTINHRIIKPMNQSVQKKIEKFQKVDNPCKPLIQKYKTRNQNQAMIQNTGFQIEDLKYKKNEQSVKEIKDILAHYITNNRKFFNKEVIKIPEYEKSAPFYVDSLKFADRFLQGVKQVPKAYGFEEENLYRNNLVLEKVMLERLLDAEQNYKRSEYVEQYIQEQSRLHSIQNSLSSSKERFYKNQSTRNNSKPDNILESINQQDQTNHIKQQNQDEENQ